MSARITVSQDDEILLRVVAGLVRWLPPSKKAAHLQARLVALADRIRAALPSPAEAPCTGSDLPKC